MHAALRTSARTCGAAHQHTCAPAYKEAPAIKHTYHAALHHSAACVGCMLLHCTTACKCVRTYVGFENACTCTHAAMNHHSVHACTIPCTDCTTTPEQACTRCAYHAALERVPARTLASLRCTEACTRSIHACMLVKPHHTATCMHVLTKSHILCAGEQKENSVTVGNGKGWR
jgi:hypothetical protein